MVFNPRFPNRNIDGFENIQNQERIGKKVSKKLKGVSNDTTSIFEGENEEDTDKGDWFEETQEFFPED